MGFPPNPQATVGFPSDVLLARILEIIGANGFAEVKNNFGAVIMYLNHQGFFGYEDLGSATQGPTVLALVFTPTPQNDPINGTPFQPGLSSVDPAFGDSMQTLGASVSLGQVAYTNMAQVAARAASGAVGPFTKVDAPEQTVASHLQMLLFGGWTSGFLLPALVIGFTAGAGVVSRFTPYDMEVQAQDGNVYVPLIANSRNPGQTITNALAAINGFSGINCAAGPYQLHGILNCTQGATAGTVKIQLQNTGVAPINIHVRVGDTHLTNPGEYLDDFLTATNTSTTTAAIPAGTQFFIELDGAITFSGSGTWGFEAESSVANGFTIANGTPLTFTRGLSASNIVGGNPTGYPPLADILTTDIALAMGLGSAIFNAYQAGQDYAAGQVVIQGGVSYRANNAIINSPATFNPADWTTPI